MKNSIQLIQLNNENFIIRITINKSVKYYKHSDYRHEYNLSLNIIYIFFFVNEKDNGLFLFEYRLIK
jgi:hypothetical protein